MAEHLVDYCRLQNARKGVHLRFRSCAKTEQKQHFCSRQKCHRVNSLFNEQIMQPQRFIEYTSYCITNSLSFENVWISWCNIREHWLFLISLSDKAADHNTEELIFKS